jgi:hypothetical protein
MSTTVQKKNNVKLTYKIKKKSLVNSARKFSAYPKKISNYATGHIPFNN